VENAGVVGRVGFELSHFPPPVDRAGDRVGARAISDQQPATTGGDPDVGSGLTIDTAAVYTATGIHAHRPLTTDQTAPAERTPAVSRDPTCRPSLARYHQRPARYAGVRPRLSRFRRHVLLPARLRQRAFPRLGQL
jgi:hypothetical protein